MRTDLKHLLWVPHCRLWVLLAPLTTLTIQLEDDAALTAPFCLQQEVPERHTTFHGGPASSTGLKGQRYQCTWTCISSGPLFIKAPFTQGCDLLATFERPEKLPGRPMLAWTRKSNFCVTAAARSLCLPWTTKTAVETRQVAQRRHIGGRGIAVVAQGIPRSPNGGTVVTTVIARRWVCLPSCLIWVTCERPASSATFLLLFWTHSKRYGDHGVHGVAWTSSVCHIWTTEATILLLLSI